MGMAFADRRVAHKWIFFPVFHNLIRQSHRGKAENFVARSFLLALVWSALEMFFSVLCHDVQTYATSLPPLSLLLRSGRMESLAM